MDLLTKFLADGALIVVLAGAAIVIAPKLLKKPQNIPVLVMAGLTSLLAGKLLSLLYQPSVARPFLEQGVAAGASYIDNPGFPSDHALLATTTIVAVHMLVRSPRLTIALGVIGLLMCSARVVALVHTPLDIIGGIAAGLAGAYWYRKLTN